MSEELFGVWGLGADGRVHYFLGGGPLCGGRVRDAGRPAPQKLYRRASGRPTDGGYPDTSRDCPECREMNVLRWCAAR